MTTYTDPVVLTFALIPLLLVAALLASISLGSQRLGESGDQRRRAVLITTLVAVAWMLATWLAAARGVLRNWEATPPPFALLAFGIVALGVTMSSGRYGHRLAAGVPRWALVGVQAFRLPLELAMHAMYERGVMPVQMSYSGWNFDIVTGITAPIVTVLVASRRAGTGLVLAWNILGLALLLNIVAIAILSTPRLAYFGQDRLNVWVMDPPFVWLPAVMVLAALAGHLLVFRAVRRPEG